MRLAGLLYLFATSACGNDNTQQPPAVDAQRAVEDAGACSHNEFLLEGQSAERDDELGVFFYTATSGSVPNLQRLTLDFYFPFGATDGPQDLVFDGENLRDCHTCLVARRDCESPRCADGKAFLVQSGTASITALGAAQTAFQGSLENAVFAEVTISVADLETTLVPNGETWCIDRLEFDAPVTSPR